MEKKHITREIALASSAIPLLAYAKLVQISTTSAYRLARSGEIETFRIGKSRLFVPIRFYRSQFLVEEIDEVPNAKR